MATKEDFSNEEWQALMKAPVVAAATIMAFDSGIVSKIREFLAATKYLQEAWVEFASYPIVKEIIKEFADPGGLNWAGEKPITELTLGSDAPIFQETLDILADRASVEEIEAYKAFIYKVAFTVAKAAGDGFFGFGNPISEREKEFLNRLKQELLDTPQDDAF